MLAKISLDVGLLRGNKADISNKAILVLVAKT